MMLCNLQKTHFTKEILLLTLSLQIKEDLSLVQLLLRIQKKTLLWCLFKMVSLN